MIRSKFAFTISERVFKRLTMPTHIINCILIKCVRKANSNDFFFTYDLYRISHNFEVQLVHNETTNGVRQYYLRLVPVLQETRGVYLKN